jgi:hypothetical protein
MCDHAHRSGDRPAGSAGNATAVDAVWAYHKYLPYGGALAAYGPPGWAAAGDVAEYAARAQLVQYQQLQALFEGFQVPVPRLHGCFTDGNQLSTQRYPQARHADGPASKYC